jgi:molybdopterin-guanine dinucleotide biosynthesis adapter protein
MNDIQIPMLLIVGSKSGSGKTTIVEKLIPELKKRKLRIGTIKHHHADFEMDIPGKDSWRHKKAGAEKTVISSPNRIGIVMDVEHDHSPEELAHFLTGVDFIIVEGFKGENLPKVEIFRKGVHESPMLLQDKNLIAMVTDSDIDLAVPRFGLDDAAGLAEFIISYFKIALEEGKQ